MLIKDIWPGPEESELNYLTSSGGHLYFWANDGVNGGALWVSDGTEEGTRILADFYPDTSSRATQLTVGNGLVYFNNHGELWAFDTRIGAIPAMSGTSLLVLAIGVLGAGAWIAARRSWCACP